MIMFWLQAMKARGRSSSTCIETQAEYTFYEQAVPKAMNDEQSKMGLAITFAEFGGGEAHGLV